MTEAEWLACKDSRAMLAFLRGKVSDRKARWFACACARRVRWTHESADCRAVLHAAERFADGLIGAEELEAAADYECDEDPVLDAAAVPRCAAERAAFIAQCCIGDGGTNEVGTPYYWKRVHAESAVQAHLIRCVFGNPFRPMTFTAACVTATAAGLAAAAYAERKLPSGELDPVRLAVLSDALEEAGCADAELLAHLRSPGPHIRGCWPVDLILGRK
jgi:hypothetical protein